MGLPGLSDYFSRPWEGLVIAGSEDCEYVVSHIVVGALSLNQLGDCQTPQSRRSAGEGSESGMAATPQAARRAMRPRQAHNVASPRGLE